MKPIVIISALLLAGIGLAAADGDPVGISQGDPQGDGIGQFNDPMIMQNNTTMPNTMSMPMSMPMNMPMNPIGLPNGAATNATTNVIIQNMTFNLITFMNISLQTPVQIPTISPAESLKESEIQTFSGAKTKSLEPVIESIPSANISSIEPTKTAYTRDGTTFVSKERMEENIRAGMAERSDYKEVQVPLDMPIAEGTSKLVKTIHVEKS